MSMNRADLIIGGCVIAIGSLGLWGIIPAGVVVPSEIEISALSPAFWPQVVMIGMIMAGLVVFFQGVFPKVEGDTEFSEPALTSAVIIGKLCFAVAVMFAYYYAITQIGIVLSSLVVLLLLMMLGGERKPILLISISITLPVLLYYFFTHVANVPLPLGMFE